MYIEDITEELIRVIRWRVSCESGEYTESSNARKSYLKVSNIYNTKEIEKICIICNCWLWLLNSYKRVESIGNHIFPK